MFSSSRASFVVPGMGTFHGFWGQQPRERDLRGARALPFRDPAQQIDQDLIRPPRLRSKARRFSVVFRLPFIARQLVSNAPTRPTSVRLVGLI